MFFKDIQRRLNLSDPIYVLNHLFLGGPAPVLCRDSADADDNGEITITDAVYLLNFLFVNGEPPPPPYPLPGFDPTNDEIDC